MSGSHSHGSHSHGEFRSGRAFAIGIGLNLTFVVIEVVFGLVANSIALLADAAHNFGDVLGLLLAWGASALAKRRPSARRTYGFRRTTILAALTNAVLLFVAVGAVGWEAVGRLRHPAPVEGMMVLIVAAIGTVVNGASALLFMKGRKRDANVRGAFMHLAADAVVSLGVVVAGIFILKTGWGWLDPVASLVVSLVILIGGRSLFMESINLALDAVPEHIKPEDVRGYLAGLSGVNEVHDLHIWAMSTTEVALTAHLVMDGDSCHPAFLRDVAKQLHDRFEIEHATLQVEPPEQEDPCHLASDERV